MMWSEQRPTFVVQIQDTYQFLIEDPNLVAFGPPFGPLEFHEMLPKLPITKVIRTSLPQTKIPGWSFVSSPNDADYVYTVSDLAHYPGHKYHRKRQLMNGCLNRYECVYEDLTTDIIQECFDLQKRIIQLTSPDDSQLQEHKAAHYLLNHFSHFHFFGGVIRIHGQVEGLMIASRLNDNTAVGHVEKTNPEIHGISALLHHWFAKKTLPGFEFFNVEQDLGSPGLRDCKQRFIPDHMVVKYTGLKV